MKTRMKARAKRKIRVRKKVSGSASRPRMSVFRSARHMSVQIIDDVNGQTLVSASTYEKTMDRKSALGNIKSAKGIGEMIAERAKSKGIDSVVFDRSGYRYHGRIKALAEAARQKGLKF